MTWAIGIGVVALLVLFSRGSRAAPARRPAPARPPPRPPTPGRHTYGDLTPMYFGRTFPPITPAQMQTLSHEIAAKVQAGTASPNDIEMAALQVSTSYPNLTQELFVQSEWTALGRPPEPIASAYAAASRGVATDADIDAAIRAATSGAYTNTADRLMMYKAIRNIGLSVNAQQLFGTMTTDEALNAIYVLVAHLGGFGGEGGSTMQRSSRMDQAVVPAFIAALDRAGHTAAAANVRSRWNAAPSGSPLA